MLMKTHLLNTITHFLSSLTTNRKQKRFNRLNPEAISLTSFKDRWLTRLNQEISSFEEELDKGVPDLPRLWAESFNLMGVCVNLHELMFRQVKPYLQNDIELYDYCAVNADIANIHYKAKLLHLKVTELLGESQPLWLRVAPMGVVNCG